MVKTVSTGIAVLDKALMNGVPKGSALLVTGTPGSGMELFAKQFAAAGTARENVVYFTTAERDEEITGTMADFGWKADLTIVNVASLYYETVLARKLEVSKLRQEGLSLEHLRAPRSPDERLQGSTNFLTFLTYEVSKQKPPFRIVIDNLDFFLEYYHHADVLSALRTIKAHTQHEEGVALATMLTDVYDTRTQSGIEEIVDCVIELERDRAGEEYKRYLNLRKVRNHPEKTGIHPISITKDGIAAQ